LTKCRGFCTSCNIIHPHLSYATVIGLVSCIFIADEKVQMQMRIQDHWACPYGIPQAIPTHLQNHVVWSRTLKCSVKSCVTRTSTKCYFNGLSIHVGPHACKNRRNQRLWVFGCAIVSRFWIRPTSKWWILNIVQVTMKHDLFNAT
jgi:hypothetical protein